ncbi:hypothetical protein ACROYT_G002140 [Oculina patagonica]
MTESPVCCTAQPTPSSPNSNPFKSWQDVVEVDLQANEIIIPVNNNPNENLGAHSLHNGNASHTEIDSQMAESEMQQRTRNLRKDLRLDLAETNSDTSLPPPKSSWLLRLFESKLFDMSIAIAYLFNSKEPGVLTYLGNKLFTFDDEDVNFYLPQLINMYIHVDEVSDALHRYLVERCKRSFSFALQASWLLEAYCADGWLPSIEYARGIRLLQLVLDGCRPKSPLSPSGLGGSHALPSPVSPATMGATLTTPTKKTHQRSKSDATAAITASTRLMQSNEYESPTGDLRYGHAFDSRCTKHSPVISPNASSPALTELVRTPDCGCQTPRLVAQREFMSALIAVGKRLTSLPTKDLKTSRLYAELSLLNLNLPAKVSLPVHPGIGDHYVVRIPHTAAVVLNSKDKAPYMIYFQPTLRQTRSEEHLPTYCRSDVVQFTVSGGDSDDECWSTVIEDKSKQDIVDGPFVAAGDIRRRLSESLSAPQALFKRDPEDPSAAVLKEPWEEKEARIREASPYGHVPNWNILFYDVKTLLYKIRHAIFSHAI